MSQFAVTVISPVVFAGIVSVSPITVPFVVLHDENVYPDRVGRVKATVCADDETL